MLQEHATALDALLIAMLLTYSNDNAILNFPIYLINIKFLNVFTFVIFELIIYSAFTELCKG
jgi:hypothetical protein